MKKILYLTSFSTLVLLAVCIWQRNEIVQLEKLTKEAIKAGNTIYDEAMKRECP